MNTKDFLLFTLPCMAASYMKEASGQLPSVQYAMGTPFEQLENVLYECIRLMACHDKPARVCKPFSNNHNNAMHCPAWEVFIFPTLRSAHEQVMRPFLLSPGAARWIF